MPLGCSPARKVGAGKVDRRKVERTSKQNWGSADHKRQSHVNFLYRRQQGDPGGRWEGSRLVVGRVEVGGAGPKTSSLPLPPGLTFSLCSANTDKAHGSLKCNNNVMGISASCSSLNHQKFFLLAFLYLCLLSAQSLQVYRRLLCIQGSG